jgi:hypothetical protein
MKSVDGTATANSITGNLMGYAGKHVAYDCNVEQVVRKGIMIGQCGAIADPVDVFIKLPTDGLKIGERLHLLGVIEQPAVWSDVTGHPYYYAFMRAVFVDQIPPEKP